MFISFVLFSCCCCCCLRSQFVSDNTIINRLLSLSQTKPSAIATPTVENVPRDAAEAATRAAAARCPSTCHWQVTSSCRMHWRCTATRSVWFTCTSLARRTPRPARAGVPTVWRVSEPPSFPVLHYYYLSLSLSVCSGVRCGYRIPGASSSEFTDLHRGRWQSRGLERHQQQE